SAWMTARALRDDGKAGRSGTLHRECGGDHPNAVYDNFQKFRQRQFPKSSIALVAGVAVTRRFVEDFLDAVVSRPSHVHLCICFLRSRKARYFIPVLSTLKPKTHAIFTSSAIA